MTRKFIIVAALTGALAAPAVSAHAQDGGAPPPPPQGAMRGRGPGGPGGMRGMDPFMKGIELTQTQKDSIKAIDDRMRPDMEKARKDANGDRQAMMTKMMEFRKTRTAAVRAVLTADQQKTYDKNAADLQKMMEERMKNGGAGYTPAPPPPQPQQ